MSPWSELMTALTREMPILDALIQVGERKRAAMLSDDLAQLDETVAQEAALLKRLQDEDGRIQRIMAEIKPLVNSDRLSDLIASPHCPCSDELNRLYEQILGLVSTLKGITQQNQALINQSLNYAGFVIRAMMGQTHQTGYTASGKQSADQPNRRLDFRA